MRGDDVLADATVLVTGSTQGIGLAVARAFAGRGARIATHGLASAEQVESVRRLLLEDGAREVRFFAADLRDPDAIDALIDGVEAWRGLDILVNNAGIQRTAPLEAVTRETWDEILAINLTAAFETMRRALPRMAARGYGRVINIASVHGLVASMEKAPYVASKFALIGLSRVAALEYARAGSARTGGVTVNCICPGWTDTPLIEAQIADRAAKLSSGIQAATEDLLAEKQPSLRMSDPSEIGELAVWLAGRVAHNVTGAALPIDGGWTAQ
jgi:3-hydroxybutyrate dehydrogenase